MVTLHSFDEEPTKISFIHVIGHDFKARIIFKHYGNGLFEFVGSPTERDWSWVKRMLPDYKGWLYESELMQCVKNGTRSE